MCVAKIDGDSPLEEKSSSSATWQIRYSHGSISLKLSEILLYSTSTGGGSAAPRVAKPDGVVDGIFP